MMNHTKKIFDELSVNIKKANKNARIVVLASTKSILKNLGVKSYYSLVPSSKLVKTISENAENLSQNFLKYTISKIDLSKKTTSQFNDFDNLFETVVSKLNINKKN